jgi:hypothetical protein
MIALDHTHCVIFLAFNPKTKYNVKFWEIPYLEAYR